MTAVQQSQTRRRSLLGLFVRAVDRLIPAELLDSSDTRLRARVLVVSSCGMGVLAMISHTIRALTLPLDLGFWLGLALISFFFLLPAVQFITRSARLAGGILSVTLGAALPVIHSQVGHFPAPILAFFSCFPLVLTFFLGLRSGLLGTIFIGGAAFYLAKELPTATTESFLAFLPTFITTFTVAPFLAYFLTAVYERNRARNEAELSQLNVELDAAKSRAENSDQRKTVFLRHISHELRTPLNAILGYSELLQEELDDLGAAELSEDARKVMVASKHLLGLINGLLDISKIESGTVDLSIEPIDIAEFFLGLRDTLAPLADEGDNRLEIDVDPSLSTFYGDRQRLLQLLLNLAGNACKFTSDGVISIVVVAGPRPETISLTVADTGVGMTPEKVARIFDPFVQVDDSASRRKQGSGLGLAITKKIIELLGGSITVTSEPGVGSRFIVVLPMRRLPLKLDASPGAV